MREALYKHGRTPSALSWLILKVMLGLYASLAVPLLELLQVPDFIVDWSCRTSTGKTTTLRVLVSAGLPRRAEGWRIHSLFVECY